MKKEFYKLLLFFIVLVLLAYAVCIVVKQHDGHVVNASLKYRSTESKTAGEESSLFTVVFREPPRQQPAIIAQCDKHVFKGYVSLSH